MSFRVLGMTHPLLERQKVAAEPGIAAPGLFEAGRNACRHFASFPILHSLVLRSDREKTNPRRFPGMEDKVLCNNRQAAHQYFLLERYETGMALTGTEVKSLRNGKANLKDAYATIQNGEAWLFNCHINPYEYGNRQNHDPLRKRKLLLHRQELRRLTGKVEERGLTLIPTKLYLVRGRIKCEVALAKGKKLHDKRATERRKTADREARQALKYRGSR